MTTSARPSPGWPRGPGQPITLTTSHHHAATERWGPESCQPGGAYRRSAVRRLGAVAQDRNARLGCEPVPAPQSGPGRRRIGADAVVAPVLAVRHHHRRRARHRLCRGTEPECPAGGDRSRGRGCRVAAGACGQGHRRPPAAVSGDGRRGAPPAARARHELSLQPHRRHPGGRYRACAVPGPAAWPPWGSGMPSWSAGPGCTSGCTIPWTSWAEQASAGAKMSRDGPCGDSEQPGKTWASRTAGSVPGLSLVREVRWGVVGGVVRADSRPVRWAICRTGPAAVPLSPCLKLLSPWSRFAGCKSAQDHLFGGPGRRGVWEAHHAERVGFCLVHREFTRAG